MSLSISTEFFSLLKKIMKTRHKKKNQILVKREKGKITKFVWLDIV
jgi:hypothetical protein